MPDRRRRAPGEIYSAQTGEIYSAVDIFNADGENNEVRILKRADGLVLGAFGRSGRQAGQFHWVHNLAIDSRGDVYTTEVASGKRVQKFLPTGMTPRSSK